MSIRPPLRRALWLALGTVVLALAAEWAARQPALGGASSRPLACRPTNPAPAIGAEAGASIITRDYQRHPTLGWIPGPASPHRPRTENIPSDGSPWIAVFGDGSVADSPSLPGGSLPEKLNASLELPVVSYAVAGHDLARIVERATTTFRQQQPAPRTALVGFRTAVIEAPSSTAPANHSDAWRSHLIDRLRGDDASASGRALCEQTIERERILTLLRELDGAARAQGTELIVAVFPAAAPRPDQEGYSDLLAGALDDLAIHSVSLGFPTEPITAREQTARAASALRERLAHRADYYWGTPITFGKAGNAERYQLSGFSAPREGGRWTTEPTARLEVSPPAHPGGILAEVEFADAVASKADARQLVVRVGEIAVARWPITQLRKRGQDTFFLDAGIAAVRPLEIRFELESLKSLEEVGRGKHRRKLGVLIKSLTLRPDRRSSPAGHAQRRSESLAKRPVSAAPA